MRFEISFIIVKQQDNDPKFNLLDSIRENDIKGNKNINIAEIYSNRNHTANLIDNNTDNKGENLE